MDIIQDVLIYQTQMMRNSSLGPYVPAEFSPPDHIVVVNALFYASLGVMILAAFIAMLIKSWVREFDRGLKAMSIPEQRAKTREFRYLGMERWKLPEMVAILPSLIQISLLLFAIGLALFLFHISTPSFRVTTAISGIGVLYYVITTSISVFVTSSPFHSPLSRTLGKAYRLVYAYPHPDIHDFLSKRMDTTSLSDHVRLSLFPTPLSGGSHNVALDRFDALLAAMDMAPAVTFYRTIRCFWVILLKLRPYLEEDFVEPITAITVEEVQLSTAASALKRIHDSAPNSQHSLALQSSVWQVAGGTAHPLPPSFNLPSWILDIENSEEHISRLPPAILVAMITVSLRARPKKAIHDITSGAVRRRMTDSEDPWTHIMMEVSNHLDYDRNQNVHDEDEQLTYMVSNDLTSMMRSKELHKEECLRLLRTLSELRSGGWLSRDNGFFIGICLPILMGHATTWEHGAPPDIVLLEAVITLAAISCTEDRANRRNILSSSRDHPWLLLNIRNTNLVSTLFEGTHPEDHKQLTSLLFLIVYALLCRGSYPLAVQYFTIITARGDLALHASALTAIAPSMTEVALSCIGRGVVGVAALRTQGITSVLNYSIFDDKISSLEETFNNYDEQLGASENPDPNILAILLMLSKKHSSSARMQMRDGIRNLKNPWLGLAARGVVHLDIPDGPSLPMGLLDDHRVRNMIAALSLLRYGRGNVTHDTESLPLASFLQSRELSISSVALEYYMETTISHIDPPSCYLPAAVSSAFNLMLPEEQLRRRWEILDIFVYRFERFSVEWRRNFAEGFFTLSRRPLLRPRGDIESSTQESELEAILTWEYFHAEEQEPELTDSHFSGLDWMAMAWSLRLSQRSRRSTAWSRQGKAKLQNLIGREVNETYVLGALCKLLDAAPYSRIIPIIPTLREFLQWFDKPGLLEYRSKISTRISDAVRRHHQELRIHHRFHKFHCTWYM